jgi:hypothetical protein
MKRAPPSKRDLPRQTLAVSVSTVSACMNAAHPTAGLSGEPLSLTFQGELSTAQKTKRPIVVVVRKRDMSLGGRVYPQRRVLNAWVNLPSVHFSEVLILAMSGGVSSIELTTEKLQRDSGEVFGVRFATGQVQSTHERNGPFK